MTTDFPNHPIGFFDSGVGGLSAVAAFQKLNPREGIIYFGDTARVPYGSRDRETILLYAKQDLAFILEKQVKAILVACGTVSSVALDALKYMTDLPIFGIVEAASKAALRATRNRKVAVLATEATVSSHAFARELQKADSSIETLEVPCPLFVPLVENGYIAPDNQISRLVAQEYLQKVQEFGADTVILGCTHYPLLKAIIAQIIPEMTIIDSSREAACQLTAYLAENHLQSTGAMQSCFYTSGSVEQFKKVGNIFMHLGFSEHVRRVTMQEYVRL